MGKSTIAVTNEKLKTPVQFLKGVGPQRAELLNRLGLFTASDVIFFFPRDYQEMSELKEISELEENEEASVAGRVVDIELKNTWSGQSILGVLIEQEGAYLRGTWFNQPFMRRRFFDDQRVLLSGKPKLKGLRWEMSHPRVVHLRDDEPIPIGQIIPVYRLTDGIKQHHVRKIVQQSVKEFASMLDEVFDPSYLEAHDLLPIQKGVEEIHEPTDQEHLDQARRRFVYQELFVLQLALAMRRHRLMLEQTSPELPVDAKIDTRILRLFPFDLTEAQRGAIDEITSDMSKVHPMNRLLQGDVGSGKTVVAIYAMLLAVAHQHQAVLMAPTEVLARQHFRTLNRSLKESKVRIGLLTGGLTQKQRAEVIRQTEAGEIDLLIGTHAIIQADVEFSRLGLVVIDEQHKFGVRQRAKLKLSGLNPHYLVMTATPIPRTVTMSLFGDLDVSTLRTGPPGRHKVHTYLGDSEQREKWWQFFRNKLREGRQGFVITPLVDESDRLELANVKEAFEQLANEELADFRLALLHGRMTSEEKEGVMYEFSTGETQVLVATSVVEVGIDVPNATLMTIESGERFGLSQLHQLRGRVSRGNHAGFVCVFADPSHEGAERRLEAFVKTNDGFELAELDFALRGPGDLFGTQQHGMPPLRIADLLRDQAILEEARRDALEVVSADPLLNNDAWSRLKKMVLTRYGKVLDLGDVG